MTKTVVPIGISIPQDMLREIDEKRGDVTRSRYIMRILEKHYKGKGGGGGGGGVKKLQE